VKAAIFHRAVRQTIRAWPADVTRSLGKAIWELQKGAVLGMPLSRPMRSLAAGVHELRIKDSSGAYRVFYFAKSLRGVLIFHGLRQEIAEDAACRDCHRPPAFTGAAR